VSVWFECRLLDLARFEALRPDLEALIRGEVRPAVRAAAREALERIAASTAFRSEAGRASAASTVRAVAEATSDFADRDDVPSVDALVEHVCMVAYEGWSPDPAAPLPQNLVALADGRDGQLYAELSTHSPFIEQLFNGRLIPWWPKLPAPAPPRYEMPQHATLVVLHRDDLDWFDAELARVAAMPTWLEELSWDRVEPVSAAAAFARLRDLVSRARREPHLSIVIGVNG
jgi:hypothetical protein